MDLVEGYPECMSFLFRQISSPCISHHVHGNKQQGGCFHNHSLKLVSPLSSARSWTWWSLWVLSNPGYSNLWILNFTVHSGCAIFTIKNIPEISPSRHTVPFLLEPWSLLEAFKHNFYFLGYFWSKLCHFHLTASSDFSYSAASQYLNWQEDEVFQRTDNLLFVPFHPCSYSAQTSA